MPALARLVHRTRNRVRLRIPEKRKDLPYLLNLYDDLRQIPEVNEVTINPVTGSVLLHIREDYEVPVIRSLRRLGLLRTDAGESARSSLPGRIEKLYAGTRNPAGQVRTVLMAIMLGLAVHQLRRGILVAPTLTLLWYAYDLIASIKRERALLESTGT